METEELKIRYAHTYLCGHLNTEKNAEEVLGSDARWQRQVLDEEQYREACNYYYESFVDSLVETGQHKPQGVYSGTAHLVMKLDLACSLQHDRYGGDGWPLTLCNLHLFFLPYRICLFAIEIDEKAGCQPDGLTLAHSLLREVNNYDSYRAEGRMKAYLDGIQPLLDVCRVTDWLGKTVHEPHYSDLVCTGNKLKAFQIVGANRLSDELLYELGTMSPIGCVGNHAHGMSPSQSYYEAVMAQNSVSAFRNWKALALFDSFTVLGLLDKPDAWKWWRDSYFRFIYIHALYQKTQLFVVNNRFRSDAAGGKCGRLLQQMKDLEHWYAFSNISYNFLPQLIYKSIDTGLEIASEREQLHHYLVQEAERQDMQGERRIGKLIMFLTVLTVFSALYDGTSLVCDTFGILSGTATYRRVAGCLLGVVVLIFLVWGIWAYCNRRRRNGL